MDDNEEEPSGALYQLDDDGLHAARSGLRGHATVRRKVPTAACCITPIRSPASSTRSIARATARLSNKRVFARFAAGRAAIPDGPIVDAEGCLWTGVFGGWGLQRYSPQGELLTTLRLPCSAVTKAAFGGDDLRTLYITTAHVALDAEQRKQQPLAGGLFRARVDVPGLPQGIVSHGI